MLFDSLSEDSEVISEISKVDEDRDEILLYLFKPQTPGTIANLKTKRW